MPVAYEIAIALDLPLDVFVVCKIGVPYHPEYAMGAVAADGTYAVSSDVLEELAIPGDAFSAAFDRALQEAQRRQSLYRNGRPSRVFDGKTVILVDDGLATGSTMEVAVDAVRRGRAARVVLAVPVAPPGAQAQFARAVDEFVCLETPEPFSAVGLHYGNFTQVDDAEVRKLLASAARRRRAA